MLKRFVFSVLLMTLMSTVSFSAEYDPYNLHFWYRNPDYEANVYNIYGSSNVNFFYQLRDVTGSTYSDRNKVGGPQWFATVYENYYYGIRSLIYGVEPDDTYPGIYRRTMGGEIPNITIQTVGDLIDGFNFVFAEEPQPYASAWRNYVVSEIYDVYPDPVESLCLVITNGTGQFNVDFGNPYARHFPFWWDFNTSGSSSTTTKWWLQTYDWRKETYPTSEPIAYIFSSPDIYARNNSLGKYEKAYKLTTSSDKEIIVDLNNIWVLTISGDNIFTSRDTLAWTVSASHDKVYDANGTLTYTIETDSAGDMFICEIRSVNESITFSGFDSDYTFTMTPSGEEAITSGGSLKRAVNVRGIAGSDYGSRLGYISFRQRASFADGYSNYREYTTLPLVIANVANGNASVTPLLFDMIVTDSSDEIVSRVKFTWDAQTDNINQDLGTFFMIGSRDVTYKLETRITNRTGTRYELYRYDMMGSNGVNPNYRDSHVSIMPDYWKYDLTQDLYGTLPDYFLLDAHSQIAPGLVTVYKKNIGEGYRTISMGGDTAESFRLTEWNDSSPKNLRLKYRRIGGMTPIENGIHVPESDVKVQEFIMQFVDVANNTDQTAAELTTMMGKYPSMIGIGPLVNNPDLSIIKSAADEDAAEVKKVYINSSAIDAFSFVKTVPSGIIRLMSEDTAPINDTPTSGDNSVLTSGDTPGVPAFKLSEIVYTSIDIGLQPIAVRMRIPRTSNAQINQNWNALDNAENSRALFTELSKYITVWLRSDYTGERDADMFSAVNNKGNDLGVGAVDCVRASVYEDALYLDFIVLLADGKSTREGRTAYVSVFKDDDVPYILIGDGCEDGIWNMTFYVGPASGGSSSGGSNNTTSTDQQGVSTGGSGGGGGCNGFGMMIIGLSAIALTMRKVK